VKASESVHVNIYFYDPDSAEYGDGHFNTSYKDSDGDGYLEIISDCYNANLFYWP
jgi:hypothetical protein